LTSPQAAVLTPILLFLDAVACFGASGRSDETSADCTRQLQAIGRALVAYERARGALPPHLSDLSPRFLKDRVLFHCPADESKGNPGRAGVAGDPRLPISYSYEMSTDRTGHRFLVLGPRPRANTGREHKEAQRVYFGDRVPVVRCWHHTGSADAEGSASVLNLTSSGKVYASQALWEYEADTVPAVLACMERDAAAGLAQFRRRWEPLRVASYLGRFRPTPSLCEQMEATAGRLAALAWEAPVELAGTLSHVVGTLYWAAGDSARASEWRRRWTRRLLTPTATIA
jgi:hypothetical protein